MGFNRLRGFSGSGILVARRAGCVIALLVLVPAMATAAAPSFDWHDPAWIDQARSLAVGEGLALEGLPMTEASVEAPRLELERFRVFTPDATIVIHGAAGETVRPAPDNVYLRGSLAGVPGSRVLITLRAGGEVRGVMAHAGAYWMIGAAGTRSDGSPLLAVRRTPAAALEPGGEHGFTCEAGGSATAVPATPPQALGETVARAAGVPGEEGLIDYSARIAIESDFEYFQKFGNASDATDYAADLIAYTSSIYVDELATSMFVSSISLWDSASDPWGQTSTTCGLFDFGRYWNDNRTDVERTTAYFLSGKSSNSGVAWVGVLCNAAFVFDHGGACPGLSPQVDNYGGAYAYTSGIDANFDLDNPSVLWDIVATAHELGHNFNSPHTHCYQGLEGNAASIDECNASQCGQGGCFCGTPSLPCGSTGAGCGTLMSYCHLGFGGGLSNIALTLGLGHPFGVEPERVPQRMATHVASRAASNPGCLDFSEPSAIFIDGFESGDSTAWSSSTGG